MNKLNRISLIATLIVGAGLVGCSTTPRTEAEKMTLVQQSQAALTKMQGEDSSLQSFLANSAGYAVFPEIGKGGLIAGGAYGKGVVYRRGAAVGYADMSQATIGAQIGGQSYTQIVVFQSEEKLQDFMANKLTFTANASAVAVKAGAAAATQFQNGVAVFARSDAGLMGEATVGGQQYRYQAMDAAEMAGHSMPPMQR